MSDQEWEDYYEQRETEARQFSDRLETYIRAWYYGEAEATIPAGLLPPTIDNEKTKNWTLQRPEEVDPARQWYMFPAHDIDQSFEALQQHAVDNHCTYLKLIFLAPLGSQLLIEGDFPHAREMSYHTLEPFDPEYPVTGNLGVMEVPIVDVDIEPDPGHVNPFRVGADRNAIDRHYHLTFQLEAGNATALNPVLQNPYFRAPGNIRVGGPFASSGPYGDGALMPSLLWLRYYAPDKGLEPSAGVSLPRALLRLGTGETFWLQPDATLAIERQTTLAVGATTPPLEPWTFNGPDLGWLKMFGIWEVMAEGEGYIQSWPNGAFPPGPIKRKIRNALECHFSQGPDVPAPGNIAHSATDCPYNNYLIRNVFLGADKVYVFTGRLPTTPRTRNGEPAVQKAQARYWSICHHGSGKDRKYGNVDYGCLMDDEITVDDDNDYVIVWSRGAERPANARPECGVTWQDFGPESSQAATIRWMSVYPDHYMQEFAPNDDNIPWDSGAWMESRYDPTLVGQNTPGVMGPYQPILHYMTRQEFEALGCPVDAGQVPAWE